MQKEEERMRAEREKHDAKRDAQLEKERQEDLKSGKDVLDKKFQQLEFLMNKSKVSNVISPHLVLGGTKCPSKRMLTRMLSYMQR